VIAPAVAVKVAVVAPGATETNAGTVSAPLLLESATVPPAELERVTVQVVTAALPSAAAVQPSPVTVAGALSVIEADCEYPFNDAVIVAVWSVEIVPAVTVKLAVVLPDGTETDAGTASAPLLLESAAVPPAELERATVHAAEAPLSKTAGAHKSEVTVSLLVSVIDAD